MSKRLEMLRTSLAKKEAALNAKFDQHFATVKEANGQPLNDKRNGAATLRKWERQREGLRALEASIQRTKAAIEREEGLIASVEYHREGIPAQILAMVEAGTLKQWRKHPKTFFVDGVDKARIVWDPKRKVVAHKFTSAITDKEQWRLFAKTFNTLGSALNPQTA